MSSRPNSSQTSKNMFSSLPSASKIYVASTKPRQKHVPCVKRKWKKSVTENNIVHSNVDETLISLDDKSESSLEIQLVKNDSVVGCEEKLLGTVLKSNNACVTNVSPLTSNDSQSLTDENNDLVTTENDMVNLKSQDHESHEANFNEAVRPISSPDLNPVQSNLPPVPFESKTTDIDVAESVNDFPDEISTLPDLTPDHYELKISASDVLESVTVEEKAPIPLNLLQKHDTSIISADDLKSITVESNSLQLSGDTTIVHESDSTINSNDNKTKSDSAIDLCDIISENSVHPVDDKTLNTLPNEKEFDETVLKCNCNNSYIENGVNAETQTDDLNMVCNIDYAISRKVESLNLESLNHENNDFEDKESSNVSDMADDTGHSYDHSEQNSCTESGVFELHNKTLNASPSKDSEKHKDQNILLHYETSCGISNAKFMHDSTISQHSSNLKRTVSMPVDFYSLISENDLHTNIGSNVTLSSDKATLTTDLLQFKDSSTCSEQIKNEDNSLSKLKNISVASGEDMPFVNMLPPLAMMKARMRNYVFGCKGLKGSLLGSDELSRLFPQNKISVFVGTWNMNSHDSPENIDDFLLPLETDTLPDIYAIGVQESMQSKSEWEVLLQTTLGPSHVLFASSSLGALHLAIFLRRDLIWFCSVPEEANIATRVGSMVKTKGAIAVCFMLFGTSFLFVNSHLTAHEHNLVDRISDYEKICSGLDLPRSIPLKPGYNDKDVTSRFDCVFWCGDLNFRIVCGRLDVLRLLKEKFHSNHQSCDDILKHDQLQNAIREGAAFLGFKEGIINFSPSFKFDVGTNVFDSTKQRVPSYTDRILYRSKDLSSITCVHYNCVPKIVTSDHKPVYAIFTVTIKPGRDNVPLAAGIFKRDVYLEAIRRRAKFVEVNWNQKQSTICSIM